MAKKTQNDYDSLASQIGDMGGIDNPVQSHDEGQGLGKLQHRSSYGMKDELSKDEEESMHRFLQKSRKNVEEEEERKSTDTPIADGWVPVNRKDMGIRSMFYPEDWEFYIRPATVQAIKNWISVDEENLLQLNNVFNEIVKLCVKIKSGDSVVSWSNINSWDRFWFIILIRELTFASNKKTITFDDDCSECDQTITFELRSSNLHYEFPDDDLVDKYWIGSNWFIDPREYDVDHDEITLYTPTLAKEIAVIEWARREKEKNRKKDIDETFVKFSLWMMNKPSKDENMFDKQMKKLYSDYKSWDIEFFKFMDQVITNISIDPQQTLKQTCPHCGEEVVSNVQFPNGIKVLFDVETSGKRFGSR